jgi:hypothetical protein
VHPVHKVKKDVQERMVLRVHRDQGVILVQLVLVDQDLWAQQVHLVLQVRLVAQVQLDQQGTVKRVLRDHKDIQDLQEMVIQVQLDQQGMVIQVLRDHKDIQVQPGHREIQV